RYGGVRAHAPLSRAPGVGVARAARPHPHAEPPVGVVPARGRAALRDRRPRAPRRDARVARGAASGRVPAGGWPAGLAIRDRRDRDREAHPDAIRAEHRARLLPARGKRWAAPPPATAGAPRAPPRRLRAP